MSTRLLVLGLLALLMAPRAAAQPAEPRDPIVSADEAWGGRMWTFENPPLAHFDAAHGFKPDQAWLDALRLATLRLGDSDIESNSGSASFVSSEGLILTSARCVYHAVTSTLSRTQGVATINDGFVAASRDQEFRLQTHFGEWLTAAQLVGTSDVTDAVDEGVASTDDAVQVKAKRDANKKAILDAAATADPGLVPQLVSLHGGAIVRLYQYKVYDDVRLVVLPHAQASLFGGELDEITYPRHAIDFAFLRAYENGAPAETANHRLTWKPGGAERGELVFVSGSPAITTRMLTTAQLELERDVMLPMSIEQRTNDLAISNIATSISWEQLEECLRTSTWDYADDGNFVQGNRSRASIHERESVIKAERIRLRCLEDQTLMTRRAEAERAIQARVMADQELARTYGDLWDRMAAVVDRRRQHEARSRFQTADGSPVLGVIVAIVRMLDPAESEARRAKARETVEMWAGGSISPNGMLIAYCLDHLVRSRSWLPDDDPFFENVLGGMGAAAFWNATAGDEKWDDANWLGHAAPRRMLVESGWMGVRESRDPLVVAARELVVMMRRNEEAANTLDAREEVLSAELGRALLECARAPVSFDATNTPRFSDGVVRGYDTDGKRVPHQTTFYGFFARHAEFDGAYPCDLPPSWCERRSEIELSTPLNFVSTNDITVDGQGGSVVVNADLEVVGVVIDGNVESLSNDYVYGDHAARAVSTHADAIVEALVKVYGAERVVAELER